MKTPYSIQFEHLLKMAGNPGFRDHALHRARELDTDSSGVWRGIAAALTKEVAARKTAAIAARETARLAVKAAELSIKPSIPGAST